MGIDDRDWYRDELRKRDPWPHPLSAASGPLKPPLNGSLWPATWVVLLAAAVGGSVVAHDWWASNHRAVVHDVGLQTPSQRVTPSYSDPTLQLGVPSAPEPEASLPPAETREVTKCLVDGHPTYSDRSACRTGARVVVPITRGPSPEEVREAQIRADTLAEQAAEVDRRLRWEDWQRSQVTISAPAASLSKTPECAALEQAIQGYDAQARQPQPAGMQDWIKDQRSQARSRQFALHC